MNPLKAIETGFKDVASFLASVVSGIGKVASLWNLIQNNGTRALVMKIASDVLLVVQDAEAAVAADGLNFALDAETYAACKALIADAEAGHSVVAADLAALGIKIGAPAPAKALAAPAAAPAPAAAAAAAAEEVYGPQTVLG